MNPGPTESSHLFFSLGILCQAVRLAPSRTKPLLGSSSQVSLDWCGVRVVADHGYRLSDYDLSRLHHHHSEYQSHPLRYRSKYTLSSSQNSFRSRWRWGANGCQLLHSRPIDYSSRSNHHHFHSHLGHFLSPSSWCYLRRRSELNLFHSTLRYVYFFQDCYYHYPSESPSRLSWWNSMG